MQAALQESPRIEGCVWQAGAGPLAYAYSTYKGTGPKTNLPAAELPTIRRINADTLREGRPVTLHLVGRSR